MLIGDYLIQEHKETLLRKNIIINNPKNKGYT